MPFDGLRVLSLESRRAEEIATLIRKQGGEPFVAPSMREVPLDEHTAAFDFADRLLRGEFDGVILSTGVGTRLLWKTLLTRYPEADMKAALQALTLIARGPKPSAALREIGLVPNVQVPEPNTWRELLTVMRDRPESRLALQEYGKSNTELIEGLQTLGKRVAPIRIYGWDLPEDTGPLREAAARLMAEVSKSCSSPPPRSASTFRRLPLGMALSRRFSQRFGRRSLVPSGPPPPRLWKITASAPISNRAIRKWACSSTKPLPAPA